MAIWTEERGYSVCFHPLETNENSDLYACKYLKVATEQVRAADRKELPPFSVDQLDTELSKLKQQI